MIDRFRERAAWIERNVLPYEPEIRAWLGRNRIHDLEIDDIVQEMYAKISSLSSFDHIRTPKSYALRTAHSILLNHIRRSRIVSISAVGDLSELEIPSAEATPEQRTSLHEELNEIAEALATLPERTRDVLMLRRVEGLSELETAKRLAIDERTVERHMARAALMLVNRFGRGGKKASRTSSTLERPVHGDENDDS